MKIKIEYRHLKVLLLVFFVFLAGYLLIKIQLIKDKSSSLSTTQPATEVNKVAQRQNQTDAIVQEIIVTAKQFEFVPSQLRVRLGESIRLRITSLDVTHGFSLPEFGIDEVLNPQDELVIELQPTKKGEFPFSCSVSCGSGHAGMRGSLIVE